MFFPPRLYVEKVPPPVYIPYYLPCPEIFNMKLQYKGVKPFQPVAQSQYPQPKLLEPKRLQGPTRWCLQNAGHCACALRGARLTVNNGINDSRF